MRNGRESLSRNPNLISEPRAPATPVNEGRPGSVLRIELKPIDVARTTVACASATLKPASVSEKGQHKIVFWWKGQG